MLIITDQRVPAMGSGLYLAHEESVIWALFAQAGMRWSFRNRFSKCGIDLEPPVRCPAHRIRIQHGSDYPLFMLKIRDRADRNKAFSDLAYSNHTRLKRGIAPGCRCDAAPKAETNRFEW
jgi:hypothetical protein